ncbi:uncharacterized protein BYT42DRAFT_32177 [Radiomyces spectabilis]|uniref:uncharacterized protein n=1 Tax=Radiomyces spectabilis TaxID=64574 RepID=UPI00221FFBB9|nr:uncharacterized protein BYT42DRAFT_32177 [Radiomyces spectabilis]KAI8394132.1 hypothetical protein BYT42DRAFT_32177 [Radiomyces spectabilis]
MKFIRFGNDGFGTLSKRRWKILDARKISVYKRIIQTMSIETVPYVSVQPDWDQVVKDVTSQTVAAEKFWISFYCTGRQNMNTRLLHCPNAIVDWHRKGIRAP